jgi:hypothetical protein
MLDSADDLVELRVRCFALAPTASPASDSHPGCQSRSWQVARSWSLNKHRPSLTKPRPSIISPAPRALP